MDATLRYPDYLPQPVFIVDTEQTAAAAAAAAEDHIQPDTDSADPVAAVDLSKEMEHRERSIKELRQNDHPGFSDWQALREIQRSLSWFAAMDNQTSVNIFGSTIDHDLLGKIQKAADEALELMEPKVLQSIEQIAQGHGSDEEKMRAIKSIQYTLSYSDEPRISKFRPVVDNAFRMIEQGLLSVYRPQIDHILSSRNWKYGKEEDIRRLRYNYTTAVGDESMPDRVREAFDEALAIVVPRKTMSDYYADLAKLAPITPKPLSPSINDKHPLTPFSLSDFKTDSTELLADYEKFRHEMPGIPIWTCEELPKNQFGNGVIGVLFEVQLQGTPVLFKLEKRFGGGQERERYLPRYRNSDMQMEYSFYKAMNETRMLTEAAKGAAFPACHGLVWVKSKNQWGIVYEKIAGDSLFGVLNKLSRHYLSGDEIESLPPTYVQILQILIDCATGLKELDEAGYAHTDVKTDNLLVRSSDNRGIIIDHASSHKWKTSAYSTNSRQQLGTVIYNSMVPWSSVSFQGAPSRWDYESSYNALTLEAMQRMEIPEEAAQLIHQCWSDATIQEFGWDDIIRILSKLKAEAKY